MKLNMQIDTDSEAVEAAVVDLIRVLQAMLTVHMTVMRECAIQIHTEKEPGRRR